MMSIVTMAEQRWPVPPPATHRPRSGVLAGMLLLALLMLSATVNADDDIPSLLRAYCVGCHNNVEREAGVSLLSGAAIQEGSENGPLLNKDNASHSRLLQVLDPDSDLSMPPEGEAQPTPEERHRLRQWILQGAPLAASVAAPQVPKIKVRRPSSPVFSSARVSDDDVCIGGIDRVVRMNPTTGHEAWVSTGRFGRVSRLSLSADAQWIVAACGTPGVDGHAVLLRADNGEETLRFSGHADAVYAAVSDADGTRLATAGYDRKILVHDIGTREIVQTFSGHNGSVFDLSFDPSGQVLCSASADATVKVWSLATGKRLDTLSQPQSEQYCVAVTPDGKSIVAAGADNRIRVWSLVSREAAEINPLQTSTFGHEQPITSMALSEDGRRLASAAEDGTLRVWSMQPFAQIATLPEQSSLVTSLTFLDHRRLFVTRMDGSWAVQPIPDTKSSQQDKRTAMVTSTPEDAKKEPVEVVEVEGNDSAMDAQEVALPVRIKGAIHQDGQVDQDHYRFQARKGQLIVLETFAASNKSPLDSVVEVLDESGEPVLQARMQAVRDSWFTFRGKDSNVSNDFRVFYWQEMELDDFLYSDGEVVRLSRYPRGPDSGFDVYPGFGSRHTWFGTTPTAHALLAPCYVVVPRMPEEPVTPNGLPVFPIYYRNDDDSERELGRDSRLLFTAPKDGTWVARVTDARGFQGADYTYDLVVRGSRPGYRVSFNNRELKVAVGAGQELEFKVDRIDGFSGPITIEGHDLPPGYLMSGPVVIGENQLRSQACLVAGPQAGQVTPEQLEAVRFVATATVNGQVVNQTLKGLKGLTLLDSIKFRVGIENEDGYPTTLESPLELQIRAGQTIRAFVRLERTGEDGIVSFGDMAAGLPYGVFVDNIGLNGLLLPAGTDVREFFITAAPVVQPGRYQFFLKSKTDGITSLPVNLEVMPADSEGKPVATR